MSGITHVRLAMLSDGLQEAVLKEYASAIRQEDHAMTYEECAWLYGYAYGTLRSYICKGVIRARKRRITHAEMRRYLAAKKKIGAPRKAWRRQQVSLC